MNIATKELAVDVEGMLPPLVGLQYCMWTDDDGDVRFNTFIGPTLVGLIVEPLGDDDALLTGYHVIGTGVQDTQAAAQWVARRNQRIHVGRVQLAGEEVLFLAHLFRPAVNHESVRLLLALLASAARWHPDLAAASGALTLADQMALERLGDG
jgi:hypothetical protein